MKIYWIKEIHRAIKDFFFPKQHWLIKKIPNHWMDKDYLIEVCILESIIHYVESEKPYYDSYENDEQCPITQKTFLNELKIKYNDIKIVIPKLEKDLESEWDKIILQPVCGPYAMYGIDLDVNEKIYSEKYSNIDKLEKQIDDLKTEIMSWFVQNRHNMWT